MLSQFRHSVWHLFIHCLFFTGTMTIDTGFLDFFLAFTVTAKPCTFSTASVTVFSPCSITIGTSCTSPIQTIPCSTVSTAFRTAKPSGAAAYDTAFIPSSRTRQTMGFRISSSAAWRTWIFRHDRFTACGILLVWAGISRTLLCIFIICHHKSFEGTLIPSVFHHRIIIDRQCAGCFIYNLYLEIPEFI